MAAMKAMGAIKALLLSGVYGVSLPAQNAKSVAAPVVAVVAAPVAPPIAPPAPIVAAPVQPFVLPISSLQAVVESSGLQWVGSDEEKIRAVREAMANEPKPVHVPRERKPVAKDDDGPLVLVETRKDLSQVRLPFETAPQEGQPPQ